jgi:hypothetical protein
MRLLTPLGIVAFPLPSGRERVEDRAISREAAVRRHIGAGAERLLAMCLGMLYRTQD